MKLKLTNPTDDQIDAAVAEHVAGWKIHHRNTALYCVASEANGIMTRAMGTVGELRFSRSADAVLPWLEKAGWKGASNRCGSTCAATVAVLDHRDPNAAKTVTAQQDYTQTQTPFPRAACIALLRAHGVEVEFTQ